MENNKLNISRPLLSVRRALSMTTSPSNSNRENENRLPVRPTIEISKPELNSGPLVNSGSVPFGWEQSPGRPKNETDKISQTKKYSPTVPKLPPGRCLKPVKKDLAPNAINIAKNGSSSSRDDNDHHHESDSDEAYMDALDTLSRGETSFYNCSVSGVSGFGSNVISPGSRPDDSKMRDFMMRRFLPAAKAMTTDVPQHTLKKNVVKEKPREVKILVNTDDKKGQLRYGPNFLEDDTHDKKESEEESADDSDSDIKILGNKSSKFCGLIPRGFCSANPVRGMCMKTRFPISPAGNKTHPSGPSSSSVSSISGSENEPARIAIHEHRALNGIVKKDFTEPAKLEGSKLYNRLQGPGVSVTVSGPSQSTVSEQSPSSANKKGVSFKELLADKNKNEPETITNGQDSIVEKTLYVDTLHVVKSPKEASVPSNEKPQSSVNESFESDTCADKSKHDMKTEGWTDTEFDADEFEYTSCDKKMKGYEQKLYELLAPPPLPQSPSDSWLWRTLPSASSKQMTPIKWNAKDGPSSDTLASDQETDKNNESQSPQGPLDTIPEN